MIDEIKTEGKAVLIPLPVSRMFVLDGEEWNNNLSIIGDSAIHISEQGHMTWEVGKIHY